MAPARPGAATPDSPPSPGVDVAAPVLRTHMAAAQGWPSGAGRGQPAAAMVGLIGDAVFQAPFAVLLIDGAQRAAAERGATLMLTRISPDPDLSDWDLQALVDRKSAAGLVYAADAHRLIATMPALKRLPHVLVNCLGEQQDATSVAADHLGAAYRAVHLLQAHGHTRIGYVHGPTTQLATSQRLAAYHAATSSQRARFDVHCDLTGASGYEAALQLLHGPIRPSAVICDDDRIGVGVYQAAKDLGLTIPEQLSVITFSDGDLIADSLRPRLTTVNQPYHRMARLAMENLFRLLSTDRSGCVEQVVVSYEMVERESVSNPSA